MAEATVDRAEFLRSPERTVTATSAALQARWGTAAGDTAQSTPVIGEAAAAAEAARQLALLGAVLGEDQVLIEGLHRDLEGRVVQIDYSHPGGGAFLGGAAIVSMLVTRARVDLNAGTTLLQGFVQL
jgi:hypothetical protein